MRWGEGALIGVFSLFALFSIVVAAKAYTSEYAFHAYLFAAASIASVFAIGNRYMARPAGATPQFIDGKPNYNMDVVKVGTIFAVVWGIAGDVCAGLTALHGRQLGFEVYFVTDLSPCISPEGRDAMYRQLIDAGVHLVTSDQIRAAA